MHDLSLILHDIQNVVLQLAAVKNQVTVQIFTEQWQKLRADVIRKELEGVSNLPLFLFFFGRGGGVYPNTDNVVSNMGLACSCLE